MIQRLIVNPRMRTVYVSTAWIELWRLIPDGVCVLFARFEEPSPPSCGFCHIPYDELNMPFPAQLTYCYQCRRQKVSNIFSCLPKSKFGGKKVWIHYNNYVFLGSWCAVHNNRPACRSSRHREGLPHPGQVKHLTVKWLQALPKWLPTQRRNTPNQAIQQVGCPSHQRHCSKLVNASVYCLLDCVV